MSSEVEGALFARLAICLVLSLLCFDFAESHKSNGPGSSSHLVCISASLEVEVYLSNTTYSADDFPSELPEQRADSSIFLRNPCPSCDSSYSIFPLHTQQFIIPADEKLYVMTLSTDHPHIVYAEEVSIPQCSPLSLFKPAYFSDDYNIIYIHCRSTIDRRVYFTGRIEISRDWEFVRMNNYNVEGTFMNYYDREYDDSYTYFTYAEEKDIFIESPETLNFMFSPLPAACNEVVRRTALEEKNNSLLIECSTATDSSRASRLVEVVYLFSLDQYVYTEVIRNVSYPVCPLRVSKNGKIVVIFARGSIIIKSLYESEHLATHVTVTGSIYDGQLVEFEDRLIAVYSITEGLYAVDVGLALLGKSPHPIRLNGSEGICATPGCPLLLEVGDREIIATFDHQIMVFSLDSYDLIATVETTHQPSRYFYHGPTFAMELFPSTVIAKPTEPPPTEGESQKPPDTNVKSFDWKKKVLLPVATVLVVIAIVVLVVAGFYRRRIRQHHCRGQVSVRMSALQDPLNNLLPVTTIPLSASETEPLIPNPDTGMREQEPDDDQFTHYDQPLQLSDLDSNVNLEDTFAVQPDNDQILYIDRTQ